MTPMLQSSVSQRQWLQHSLGQSLLLGLVVILASRIPAADGTGNDTSSEPTAHPGQNAGPTLGLTRHLSAGSPLCNLGEQPPVAIGDPLLLCVFLSTHPPRKMIFRVKVEEYAELLLKGSLGLIDAEHQQFPVSTWVTMSSTDAALPLDCSHGGDADARLALASCPQIYASSTHTAPLLSLVVNLRNGVVSSFAWDNSCAGCGPDACIHSSKFFNPISGEYGGGTFEQGTCSQALLGCGWECDLKIFVTWAGTDKNGRHATSAGMRLSKFTGYTLSSLYERMSNNYDEVFR